MIRFKVKVNMPAFRKAIKEGFRARVTSFLQRVADRIRGLMRLPKRGRIYLRKGKVHQASAVGEAPAPDTRRLIGSIGKPQIQGLVGILKVDTPYAEYLEYGTPTIGPRPYAKPAVDGVLAQLNKSIGNP